MEVSIFTYKAVLGKVAAETGVKFINKALDKKGSASIIVATGTSQFETLSALIKEEVDWSRITAFHLDEYIGIPMTHPASFRKYLKERFVDQVSLKAFHYISGEEDPSAELGRLNGLIAQHDIDVAFVGIGENGHLAFNDPPADFETEEPYIVVDLDEACRQQQLGEGWFSSIEEVPGKAISMSVRQIMKSKSIICSVPDARKARAVKNTLEEAVSPLIPASVLTTHGDAWLYLDQESASLLKGAEL